MYKFGSLNMFMNKYGFILLITFVFLIPFGITYFSNEYLPGYDEAWQVQAAKRLYCGEGYTASRDDIRFNKRTCFDLASNQFDYLAAWPPGYSLTIAGLLGIGLKANSALKNIQFSCYHFWCIILDFYC